MVTPLCPSVVNMYMDGVLTVDKTERDACLTVRLLSRHFSRDSSCGRSSCGHHLLQNSEVTNFFLQQYLVKAT